MSRAPGPGKEGAHATSYCCFGCVGFGWGYAEPSPSVVQVFCRLPRRTVGDYAAVGSGFGVVDGDRAVKCGLSEFARSSFSFVTPCMVDVWSWLAKSEGPENPGWVAYDFVSVRSSVAMRWGAVLIRSRIGVYRSPNGGTRTPLRVGVIEWQTLGCCTLIAAKSLSENGGVGYFRQMLFGYARVSSADQNPAHQIDALERAGIDSGNIHIDHAGGTKASRPQLDALLTRLRSGDTLVITRLDRLGRSVLNLITLGAELRERGIGLQVLEQGIDTATVEGRAMFGMLSVLAELQRELIVANTRDGLATARARGRKGGRPSKLSGDQIVLAQQLYDAGEKTVVQIAEMLSVPRTTVYGHLDKRSQATRAQTRSGKERTAVTDPVPAVRSPRICPSCGYEPSTRAEAVHQRADLAVIWLHPNLDDPNAVVARSHCRHCEPPPPAFDVACVVCGDGPILADGFAQTAQDGILPDPVQQWLTASGWAVVPELQCPDHR